MSVRRVLLVVIVLVLAGVGAWWYFTRSASAASGPLVASGTIEANQVNVSPEAGGRVTSVKFKEGDTVKAGDALVQFDATLLAAQRKQTEAALAAATANYNSLQSGAVGAQLQAAVAQAQTQVLGAQQGVQDLQDQAAVSAAQAQQAVAQAATALAKAQTELSTLNALAAPDSNELALAQANEALATAMLKAAQNRAAKLGAGPDPDLLALAKARLNGAQAALTAAQAATAPAQLAAAKSQVDTAQAALDLLDVQLKKLTVTAPVDGVVLSRAIEPGEVASPGATLMVIGPLSDLKVTVYVPEDRYGAIQLGQTTQLSVDSFPGQTFTGTVRQIASQAEFTPRNSQTVAGRKVTVFAVQLAIANPDFKLKPGMPADVKFGQ